MLHLGDIKLSRGGGVGGATNDGRFGTISLRRKTSVSAVVVICYFESDSCIFGVIY